MEKNLSYPKVSPFSMKIKYAEIDALSAENEFNQHIHPECEIYINLSGDVSFVVENHIYPISPGDIIITRPYEYHHCVYHSNKLHKHFWILFSAAGNESLLNLFYRRNPGERNLLTLSPDNRKELISLCHHIIETKEDSLQQYYHFFRMLMLLENAHIPGDCSSVYPSAILSAIDYINQFFAEPITIREIAHHAHVSVNTLERHFSQFFHLSPTRYIRKKRLSYAARLLSEGVSVAETSRLSGFPDDSNFIACFKRVYGMTPLQYKKKTMV